MAQVSVGQVENLEDLVRGLESVRETLEAACREQVAAAERDCDEAREETRNSESLLDRANQAEQAAYRALAVAEQHLESAMHALSSAESALSACEAQPPDEEGNGPNCSREASAVAVAQAAVEAAQEVVEAAQAAVERAVENRQQMEQRVEYAKQAFSLAEQAYEQTQQECSIRMSAVGNSIDVGKTRLTAAQHALEAYLASNPPVAQFRSWLDWTPMQGQPITPDLLRDRMNILNGQPRLLQEYLYDRDAGYRNLVDKYRNAWAAAQGDVERNIINRNARIHLCGAYAEHLARHALAPLGDIKDTQVRTYIGHQGRYTKTDLIVSGLRTPVILGRGAGMGAPVGGSMAFEVKCGKADYLFREMDHMMFQAEGHKQADAHCTLCSRDIHDLPPGKEKELRDALRAAGSPLVGMLPLKNDIDQSCLGFIHRDEEESQ